jgi:medium-chain acyl-[acyl-carrier-protein] hydrolase
VQYPGREARAGEQPLSSIEQLVDALVSAMRSQLDRPFVFFGHSMGALIAFELTRALYEAHGAKPEHVFLSGAPAPHLALATRIADLSSAQFLRQLVRLNGIPREVFASPELLRCVLPVMRADFAALEGYIYRAGPALPCPLTVLGGEQDPRVCAVRLSGWSQHASVYFSSHMFPGDHFFVRSAQAGVLRAMHEELLPVLTSIMKEHNA